MEFLKSNTKVIRTGNHNKGNMRGQSKETCKPPKAEVNQLPVGFHIGSKLLRG